MNTSNRPTYKNRYYLMRHGQSLANKQGLIVSLPENAIDDYGLTNLGSEQVLQTAFSTRLDQSTIIVSSDYRRTRESAEIIHGVLGCQSQVHFDERLRERQFGDWELQDHGNYSSVWEADLVSPENPPKKVESVYSVLNRALSLIDDLEARFSQRRVLLVGHGDVIQIVLAHHHNINARFHRSISTVTNAQVRCLAKLDLAVRFSAA